MTVDPVHNDPTAADLANAFQTEALLPNPLPHEPFGTFCKWFDAASEQRIQPNPNAMVVCSVSEQGVPSARVVLCRGIDPEAGHVTFFTNRESMKGRELALTNAVAAVFHWDVFDKQVRIEGVAEWAPDSVSEAYFSSRTIAKRLGAWASDQSQPIESRDAMIDRVRNTQKRFGVTDEQLDQFDGETGGRETELVPRPEHWGGVRIWVRALELWVGHKSRIHDRARYERQLIRNPEGGFTTSAWSVTRLQP